MLYRKLPLKHLDYSSSLCITCSVGLMLENLSSLDLGLFIHISLFIVYISSKETVVISQSSSWAPFPMSTSLSVLTNCKAVSSTKYERIEGWREHGQKMGYLVKLHDPFRHVELKHLNTMGEKRHKALKSNHWKFCYQIILYLTFI